MRIRSLDSLRGVAAAAVVLHHSVQSLGVERSRLGRILMLTPLRLFLNAPGVVLIFFVMSGMVLSLALLRAEADGYVTFLVKRAARLWPAAALALGVSALLMTAIGYRPLPDWSSWFNYTWAQPIRPARLLADLTLTSPGSSLDMSIWSLLHEVRLSLVFPLLLLATRRRPRLTGLAGVGLLLACVKLNGHAPDPAVHAFAMTGAYVFVFYLGILLALHFERLKSRLLFLPAPATAALWTLALLLVIYAPPNAETVRGWREAAPLLTGSLGATLVVCLCAVEGRAFRLLLGPVPSYLGRISYGLFLWHMVVITALGRLLDGRVPPPVVLLMAAGLSVAVADLSRRWVEQPSIRIGRRLADALQRKSALLPQPA